MLFVLLLIVLELGSGIPTQRLPSQHSKGHRFLRGLVVFLRARNGFAGRHCLNFEYPQVRFMGSGFWFWGLVVSRYFATQLLLLHIQGAVPEFRVCATLNPYILNLKP